MPVPWSKEEEIKLINEIKEKKSYEEISKIHDRSISALMMRYNKIVYDNIEAGKSKKSLGKLFNKSVESITQSYYEHKAFLDKKDITNQKKEDDKNTEKNKVDKSEKINTEKSEKNDDKYAKLLQKINIIQKENILLKEIIENIKTKNKLNKSLNDKELFNEIIRLIKKYNK